ncbi:MULTISPECIES: endo-beta-N-acetylglucosaminidase [Streptomyces]|uniref:Endo-beta-N-acetylglucosaminidase n=1 Tax=Streptomyces koelreuteriae TaxID=2838015 RepID=A0ABX8FKQ2_9ACTN|nr:MULTISPECIES: endo-beta-N-acetylglucosaminidase [Streptomyces]QWB21692.1 endo-beta-N-acetylglucosaminidase [Streptomyces koelreuteriae]UUA04618.1 endo-beta-N-acetylglucosaminidase [Streptomyces koelreuteriae]UUA12242.1 endo-beta-N-acetylglucosaminidase [Streptomyces sp. CRCS-T-1]
MTPTRRTVLLAGAAAALFPSPQATAAPKAAATQPYASYWYPDSLPSGTPGPGITWRGLKSWRADTDPDLAFNAASVPLAARFTPAPANPTARAGQARIQSLVSFGPTASNPSQGSATADYYALTHWAYIDELVFWGGSSGEGLILAPNAPIVDAAHRHGVPVLGNVFLPPVAYGGQLRWTRDLVQKDTAGRHPLAARLVEVAEAYGFDGWFVNAETGGGDAALGADMLSFMRELKSLAAAKGQRVTWYDAMTVNGTVSWQGALNGQNEPFFRTADDMFVDFRWSASSLVSSGRRAEQLGRSRHELWAGVDVEANGWNSSVRWDAIVPKDKAHIASIGLYRPEWTRNHLPADQRGPAAFHAADDRFWTGRSLDPSRPDGTDSWRAPAVSVADRSTVTSVPFASVFNTGHGLRWYEDGAVTSDAPWNHLGLQDRLPSRRWVVRTEGRRPAVGFDFADAWRGGSSVLVDGELDAPTVVEVYETRLPIGGDTVVELTHRTDAGAVRIELAVATGEPGSYTYLPVDSGQAWQTSTVRLTGLTGTVHSLGVRLTATDGPVTWRLGGIAVRDAIRRPVSPTGFRVTAASGGDLRLAWDPAPGEVRHHTLHRVLPDGTRRFLGGTCQRAFFVAGLKPEQGERAARFELRAVGELYTSSAPVSLTHPW